MPFCFFEMSSDISKDLMIQIIQNHQITRRKAYAVFYLLCNKDIYDSLKLNYILQLVIR